MTSNFKSPHTNYSFHLVLISVFLRTVKISEMLKYRGALIACIVAGLSISVAYLLQPTFLYMKRRYSADEETKFVRLIKQRGFEFHKLKHSLYREGSQFSYLILDREAKNTSPGCHVVVLFGGNGMTAFDWGLWIVDIRSHLDLFSQVAFVLVDYPGYGANEGSPSPDSIQATARESIKLALGRLRAGGISPAELSVVGHSIGSGVAVKFVELHDNSSVPITRLILSAPFTSIVDMVPVVFPMIPMGIAALISRHNWDSRASLANIIKGGGPRQIYIVHGQEDEIVPFRMGEELSKISESRIHFVPVKTAAHNDVLSLVKVYGLLLNRK